MPIPLPTHQTNSRTFLSVSVWTETKNEVAGAGRNQIELVHLEKPTETQLCGTETKTGSLEKKKKPFLRNRGWI